MGGQAEVLELAELLGIPVCDAEWPYHNFPRRSPLFAGGYATPGRDLILRIGVADVGGTAPVPLDDTGTCAVWVGLNTQAMGSDRPMATPPGSRGSAWRTSARNMV